MQREPKLQKPGAGLPLIQKIVLRLIIGPFQTKKTPWEVSRARYEKLTGNILKVAESIPLEKRKIKVLVDPIVGLEDSSRYWSVDMLLEHLMIVSKHMEGIILQLTGGTVPDVKVDIARVKPTVHSHDATSQEILAEYSAYAPTVMQKLDAGMKNRESKLTLTHPWFGKCTARQWYWVLAAHQGIHWQQLKQIRNKLS